MPGVYAYTASAWENELRLSSCVKRSMTRPEDRRLGYGDDKPVLLPTWKFPGTQGAQRKRDAASERGYRRPGGAQRSHRRVVAKVESITFRGRQGATRAQHDPDE